MKFSLFSTQLTITTLLLATGCSQGASDSNSNGGVVTVELWCVAKNNAQDSALQSALDWACGPGGADCSPIQSGGPCYDASSIIQTASYAFNDYYLKHGLTDDSCYFNNNAALTSLDPSHGNCKFPSSFTRSNVSGSPPTMGLGPQSSDLNGNREESKRVQVWSLLIPELILTFTFVYSYGIC
ncbi:X8 domain [Dillenia turbinata]|uniref:X8 domain n=1 Tax=Dillenia turbinata TaxID=194707 RepID=A0AAN8UP08_9MAGN